MFGIGTSEWIVFGIIAAIMLYRCRAEIVRALRTASKAFANGICDCKRDLLQLTNDPPRVTQVELVTKPRDTTMTERFKKFLWSPAFWATLGIIGCATGLYFQRLAANGTGLWCLGLMFLGAAYIEHKDL